MGERVIIEGKILYPHCFHPNNNYGRDQYSLSLVIPKDDEENYGKAQAAIEIVKKTEVDKWGGKTPPRLRLPLHDGDEEKPDNSNFRNSYYLNLRSKEAPQIVDRHVKAITNEVELYSGCFGNVSVVFYGYNNNGNKGIGAYLGNIQKIRDGKPLNRRISAVDEFTDLSGKEVYAQQSE